MEALLTHGGEAIRKKGMTALLEACGIVPTEVETNADI